MINRAILASALLSLVAAPAFAQSSGGQFSGQGGENTFKSLCAACHMPDGTGYAGIYPALAKNPKLATAAYPALVILKGQNAMPALGGMLSDQQVADVINYVRSNLGNSYKPTTTPAEVAGLRR